MTREGVKRNVKWGRGAGTKHTENRWKKGYEKREKRSSEEK